MRSRAQIEDSAGIGDQSAELDNFPKPSRVAPPHVLFIIDQLCETGGAERCLLNMIRLMPKGKFRCSLVTFKIDRSGIFSDLPCPLYVFPLQRTYDWNGLKVARAIRNLIRSENVSIVHTFFETSDLFGGLVAKLSGAKLVSSRRDMGILRVPKHQLAYRLLNPMFDMVLTVSEQVRSFCLQSDGLSPRKVRTLYNGIELDRIDAAKPTDELRTVLQLDGASHVVATVAHIRKVKGIDLLVRAAAQVCRELPRAQFLVIGDASDREYFRELQQLTASLGVASNVRFLGPSEAVFSILKVCDAFCLPSRSEGFANALIEAMACGLPCVATRVGGNAEALTDGHGGFLVASEDVTSLATKILVLLRDPVRARQMGEAGREVVERKFSAGSMMEQLVSLYDALLDDTRE
jgi:glycosyltransferase involved in cell wall biosynthesis